MSKVRDIGSGPRKNPLFPRGFWPTGDDSKDLHVDLKRLEVTLFSHTKRLQALEEKSERRRKPKARVVNTHKAMVQAVYGDRCPCCMKPMENPEVDHFSSRAWNGLHDTWLVCEECNRALYHGKLIRAEILPRFATYQAHLKRFVGGEQLSLVSKMKLEPVKPEK